jgi:hypothetical protein
MAERCVCCGEIIPEGRQVCPNCEKKAKERDAIDFCGELCAFAEDIINRAKQKWIPVTERLPESGKCVLVCSKDGMVAEGSYKAYEKKWTQFRWNVTDLQNVTHWMPLPTPPKGE